MNVSSEKIVKDRYTDTVYIDEFRYEIEEQKEVPVCYTGITSKFEHWSVYKHYPQGPVVVHSQSMSVVAFWVVMQCSLAVGLPTELHSVTIQNTTPSVILNCRICFILKYVPALKSHNNTALNRVSCITSNAGCRFHVLTSQLSLSQTVLRPLS
jgi:hypothetical protein